MDNINQESLDVIKKALEKGLGVTFKTVDINESYIVDEEKKIFTKLIKRLEKLIANEDKIYTQSKIDITTIVEPYWAVIEDITSFCFSDQAADLIWWYIYDRKDSTGKIQPWEDSEGIEYKFNNPGDLYEYILNKFNI